MFRKLTGNLKGYVTHPDNRLILTLFFPILLEQFLTVSMGTVHSIMVSGVGKEAISAVGLVDQLNGFFVAFFLSLSTGTTVLISQYIGSKNQTEAKKCAGQAMLIGVFISLVTGAILWIWGDGIFNRAYGKTDPLLFDYAMVYLKTTVTTFPTYAIYALCAGIMRGSGEMKKPMQISFVAGIINVIVSGVCIYGFKLGILGAGIGLIISRIYASAHGLYSLYKSGWIRELSDIFPISFFHMKNVVKIGTFVGTETILFAVGKLLTNSYIVAAGTDHIAANSIAGPIYNIVVIPGNALAIVATALVGRYIGAKDTKEAKGALIRIAKMCFYFLLIICVVIIPLYPLLFRLYTTDTAILPLLWRIMLMNSIFMPLSWVFAALLPAGFRGAGDVLFPSINTVVTMWLCRILLSYIFTKYFNMGVIGVWFAQYIEWHVRGAVNYLRFRSGKWLKKKLV